MSISFAAQVIRIGIVTALIIASLCTSASAINSTQIAQDKTPAVKNDVGFFFDEEWNIDARSNEISDDSQISMMKRYQFFVSNWRDDSHQPIRELTLESRLTQNNTLISNVETWHTGKITSTNPYIVIGRNVSEDTDIPIAYSLQTEDKKPPFYISRSFDRAYFESEGFQTITVNLVPKSYFESITININIDSNAVSDAEASIVGTSSDYFSDSKEHYANFDIRNPIPNKEYIVSAKIRVTPKNRAISFVPGVGVELREIDKEEKVIFGKDVSWTADFGIAAARSLDNLNYHIYNRKYYGVGFGQISSNAEILPTDTEILPSQTSQIKVLLRLILNKFLDRSIAPFLLLIILAIVLFKESNPTHSSYVIAGLSAYALLDIISGVFRPNIFVPIGGPDVFLFIGGLGAAVFGILSKDIRMTVSLALRGFASEIIGFVVFWYIMSGFAGNPERTDPMFLSALFIWGSIYGIGLGSIYKNFGKKIIMAAVSAFGFLLALFLSDMSRVAFGVPPDPPFGYGIFGGILGTVIGDGMHYVSAKKTEMQPKPEMKPEFIQELSSEEEQILAPDIKRGYAVLPNNDIKFGIRITNNTGYTITDVDTILDYTEELFKLKKSKIQCIGNIPPDTTRTAPYILKPLGCIHSEQINALITYKDHTGKKQTLHMRPKEVHCVCPFLKEKPLSEGEYSRLAASSEFVQEGISFKGISIEELSKFMGETCRHMLYKVREYDLEDKKVIYLSGESLGEKAYYLLTAVIQEYKGLTQVLLRAHSDKKYGLNGFMNEMADSIRHLVGSVQSAKEIGIIENTQVINIIDSVVQRTSFDMGDVGKAQVNIRDSMVQRSNIGEKDK